MALQVPNPIFWPVGCHWLFLVISSKGERSHSPKHLNWYQNISRFTAGKQVQMDHTVIVIQINKIFTKYDLTWSINVQKEIIKRSILSFFLYKWQTSQNNNINIFSIIFFRLRGIDVVINAASHLTGCDVKQGGSADRKCAGLTPSVYAIALAHTKCTKHRPLTTNSTQWREKCPTFQMVSNIWKNNLCLSLPCNIFAIDAICVPWQVELSIAQLDENH